MDLVCKAKETPDPEPEYAIRVNGEEIIGVKRNNQLEARVSVNEDHFNPTRRSIGYRPQVLLDEAFFNTNFCSSGFCHIECHSC